MMRRMQVRALYVSRAVGPQTSTVTASILATAQAHNRQHGIGGVLCQGRGLYLQVLEGERSAVHRLYSRIVADRRHSDVEMLHLEEITERRYAGWHMALVDLADDAPMVRMKHPEFDPYSASGAFVMTLVDELLASGHRIELTAPGR
jgi:Sensors of blue-light using FAD